MRWEVRDDATAVMALADDEGCAVVGVDVPQGLPRAGPRRADAEARARLGSRASSVFPAPPRAVLDLDDHAEACRELKSLGQPAVSVQAFGLRHAVRQWDALLRADPDLQDRVVEVHPEASFAALAGGPLAPKRSPQGVGQRLRALARDVPDVVTRLADLDLGRPAPAVDDVLDAAAAAWSAARVARGEATSLPADPPRDEEGLLCRVLV